MQFLLSLTSYYINFDILWNKTNLLISFGQSNIIEISFWFLLVLVSSSLVLILVCQFLLLGLLLFRGSANWLNFWTVFVTRRIKTMHSVLNVQSHGLGVGLSTIGLHSRVLADVIFEKFVCCYICPVCQRRPGKDMSCFYSIYRAIILRFIFPCKSNCQPIFGIARFVTWFTHVKTHFWALSR